MDRIEVEKLKADIDIVTVISEYVHLKKRGRSYIGLCPFHKEKTPSFNVDPVKQIYKCFGCDKGGDVINFVMEMKGLSFLEAIKELASQFNIPVDLGKTNKSSETKQFYEINRYAMEFYKHMLSGNQGSRAREYLHKRGLSDETIQAYHIGYALPSWDSLLRVLQKKGISFEKASACGLLIERENGGYYDRFRDRVMFPILDITSEVIGFGGRVMDSSEPKYINTPESPVFKKRKVLYNLYRAKSLVRESGVKVVEGYMDVVSLSNAGVVNAVATLGTALSEDHVNLLSRFTQDITLIFDGDSAGKNAMRRAVEPFFNNDIIPKVVVLPMGKDPDDIVRSETFNWDQLMNEARSIWDFIFDESFYRRDPSKLEDQNAIIKELVPMISRMRDRIVQDLLVQRLSVRLGVSPESVYHQLGPAESQAVAGGLQIPNKEKGNQEYIIVKLMLFDDDAIRLVRELGLTGAIHHKDLSELAAYLIREGTKGIDDVRCPDHIRVFAAQIRAEGEFPGDKKKALIDTLCRFKTLSIESDIRRIQQELSRVEKTENKSRLNQLLKERQEKMLEKKHVRNYVMEVALRQ
ncbi:MAG TPA: DNA primase [Deltaproteobacteria bacterium]|nr:DNA primase [Deltaproteobacteria bacterium]HPR51917.1 DNA primase [Deltaproteobacteria bacterium]